MDFPCSNCVRRGIECVPAIGDLRKERYSKSYVKSLETHIAYLETSLNKIKSTPEAGEREKLFDSLPTTDFQSNSGASPNFASPTPTVTSVPPQAAKVVNSSIYPSDSLSISSKRGSMSTRNSVPEPTSVRLRCLSRSPLILRALSNFFRWLYPGHYMFIHRETFLSAFFGDPSTKSYYCSEELVLAIAALGALLSDKSDELYQESTNYYTAAKSKVLKKIFQLDDSSLDGSTPSSKLAYIQTLLCLAFYDIGNGENPLAWYLSGLAFRIAHEIGLHLNPKAWNNVYADDLSHVDIEVRSRIYWGCYIADHLICVLFGRSTSLRLSNSTIPETDELPDIETGIEDYQYSPNTRLSLAHPLKKLIVLSRMTEVFARKIFVQAENVTQRNEHISKFNLEIYNWRMNLPEDFKWTKTSVTDADFDPTLAYVWYHYYIILLSYNKPFMDELENSRAIIEEAIQELYHLLVSFKAKFKTFQKCNIYMVYSTILAIQCLKSGAVKRDHLKHFMNFLGSPALNYDLGRKIIDAEVNTESFDLFGTLSNGNDFALEYDFDFTLLNEIDMLIGSETGRII